MKTKVYLGIAIRIVIYCSVGFLWTYLPEQLNKLDKSILNDQVTNYGYTYLGARHVWLNICMIFLFALSLLSSIIGAVNLVKSNYNTQNW